jgi:hypothetical protein
MGRQSRVLNVISCPAVTWASGRCGPIAQTIRIGIGTCCPVSVGVQLRERDRILEGGSLIAIEAVAAWIGGPHCTRTLPAIVGPVAARCRPASHPASAQAVVRPRRTR